jgi:hypothetical protein
MKPASEWALEFLSKHVFNTRESGEFDLKKEKFHFLFANFLFEKLTKLKAKK